MSGLLGVPSEYSIPGLTLTLLNINSIMLDYGSSREVLEVLQGILVFMVFVLLSRFCAIGYSIAGFVMTLKKKSIAETHLIGASGRSLCLAILVALITLFLNGILADSGNEYITSILGLDNWHRGRRWLILRYRFSKEGDVSKSSHNSKETSYMKPRS